MAEGELVGIGARLSVVGAGSFASEMGKAGNSINRLADVATANFKRIGTVMSVFGGSILAASAAMGSAANDFDEAMRNVQTISRAAQADFEGMGASVLDVARDVNKSGHEAALGLYEIVSSGFDGSDALNVLEQSARAASAGMTDVFTASMAVVAVLNAYGMGAAEAASVSDILFQTVNLGVGSFEELSQSVGQVVGLASQSGVAFDEIGAAISAVSRSGIRFEEAATGVNRILVEMLQPSDQLQEVLVKLGYSSGIAALQQDGLRGTLEKIRGELGENSAAYVTLFGRIEATKAALALAANDGETYRETFEGITNETSRAGAASRAFEIQQQAVKAQVRDVMNSMVSLGQSGLTPLIGMFARILAPIKASIDFLDRLPGPIKAAVAGMGLFIGIMSLLVGGAFLLLPRIALVAGLAMLRYNTAVMASARSALAAASSNSLLAASMLRVVDFATDASFVRTLFSGMGRAALGVGLVTAAMVLLSNTTKEASQWAAELGDKLTDSEARDKVLELADAIAMKDMPGGRGGWVDQILGQTLEDIDDILGKVGLGFGSAHNKAEEAEKGFKELARTNIDAAKRLYQSAKMAGTNEEALDTMKAAIIGAERATKDNTNATEQYVDSAGNMLLVTDDVKEALDDFRERADDIRSGFGGIFDDPAQAARNMAEAVQDANEAVIEAERGVVRARSQVASESRSRSRDMEKAERDLAKARRDAATAAVDRPRRQRGESVEEYHAKIADRVASAQERVVDSQERISELRDRAAEPTDKVAEAEKRLAEARERAQKAQAAAVVTAGTMLAAMREQGKVLNDLFTNLDNLGKRGLSQPMIEELRELGPKGAAQIAALNRATDAELIEYRKTWERNNALTQGIALQGAVTTDPGKLQAQLSELWTSVGGDVGEFLRLGASAGEKALLDFIKVKLKAAADDARTIMVAALPPEWQVKVKVTVDEAALNELRVNKIEPIIEEYMLGRGSGSTTPPPLTEAERKAAAIDAYTTGGMRRKPYHRGGVVDDPAGPGEVDARLLTGEFIVNKEAVSRIGVDTLNALNLGRIKFHQGGMVMASGGVAGRSGVAARSDTTQSLDKSTHMTNEYKIDKVVVSDPAEFYRYTERKRRLNSLSGSGPG